ncbi:MAG: hypothetical protein AAGI01_03595, partial [Myxococcota bacterium]
SATLSATDSSGTSSLSTMLSGATMVTPTEDTTYTLDATGSNADTARATVVVDIFDPATIDSFSASPNPAPNGDAVTLTWTTSNGAQLSIINGQSGAPLHTETMQSAVDSGSHTFTPSCPSTPCALSYVLALTPKEGPAPTAQTVVLTVN